MPTSLRGTRSATATLVKMQGDRDSEGNKGREEPCTDMPTLKMQTVEMA